MKTIISKCKISLGMSLFIAALSLFTSSCSMEELPEPYPQPAEDTYPSTGDLLPTTTPGDTIIWSWGMIEGIERSEWIMDDSDQQIISEPN